MISFGQETGQGQISNRDAAKEGNYGLVKVQTSTWLGVMGVYLVFHTDFGSFC